MPWQIPGQQAWASDHPHAKLFTRLDSIALNMKPGEERNTASRRPLAKLPKDVSTDYLMLKVHDARFGCQMYKGALRHLSGEELEGAAARLDTQKLLYKKGKDENFFTAQGKGGREGRPDRR